MYHVHNVGLVNSFASSHLHGDCKDDVPAVTGSLTTLPTMKTCKGFNCI
ncbi:hypothetical protein TDB9533_01835 [Thalassocella blandensis]|nr:hypothetical protein TDB9533_01835 [Thalassocella blandensis]